MSNYTSGAHGWVISYEELKKLCPTELLALEDCLDEEAESLGGRSALSEFAHRVDVLHEDLPENLQNAYDALCEAFKKATSVGVSECLELGIIHYDAENGEQGDDLEDGANWIVYGMEVLSPAGRVFQDRIQQVVWTTHG